MKNLFERTYNNNFSYLVKYAQSYVKDEGEAENIVQEVFIHIWIKLNEKSNFRKDINNISYLTISVRNKCLDYLKQRVRNVHFANCDDLDYFVRKNPEMYIQEEYLSKYMNKSAIIMQAINNLPPKCRQIFIEKKIYGQKQINIASKYNISIKTIEKQMSIAYHKLRLELNYLLE